MFKWIRDKLVGTVKDSEGHAVPIDKRVLPGNSLIDERVLIWDSLADTYDERGQPTKISEIMTQMREQISSMQNPNYADLVRASLAKYDASQGHYQEALQTGYKTIDQKQRKALIQLINCNASNRNN